MAYQRWKTFGRCVDRYQGDFKVQRFHCTDYYRAMAIAQMSHRSSLRDLVICLNAHQEKLYHLGLPSGISRSTLADAGKNRDWRIYANYAQHLISLARPLYDARDSELNLQETVYALDSSTIDLCLSLFPWAPFRRTKAGIKLHALLDLQGNIPSFIEMTDAKLHDVNLLDALIPEPGSIYAMDRAYVDYRRLHAFHSLGSYFVVRAKSNLKFRRQRSHPSQRDKGLIFDQSGVLGGDKSRQSYPDQLRLIKFLDRERDKELTFLTNNTYLPALTIAQIYKNRWQVELFFRWIKQHLKIQSFFGISENAVKSQIWIGVSVYVLLAIIKKKLNLDASLYTISQIIDTTLFEKMPLTQLFRDHGYKTELVDEPKQLNLFDNITGH
jgi:hypothetical protein